MTIFANKSNYFCMKRFSQLLEIFGRQKWYIFFAAKNHTQKSPKCQEWWIFIPPFGWLLRASATRRVLLIWKCVGNLGMAGRVIWSPGGTLCRETLMFENAKKNIFWCKKSHTKNHKNLGMAGRVIWSPGGTLCKL